METLTVDYALLNDPDMQEIFEGFVIETNEIFEKLDLDLVEIEKRPDDADLLNEIFRSFHTIKGTSGFLGLVKLQNLTHHLEDILNKLRKGEAKVNGGIMDGILHAYDNLRQLLTVIENQKNEDCNIQNSLDELIAIINDLESGGNGDVKVTAKKGKVASKKADVKKAETKKTVSKKTDAKSKVTKKTVSKKKTAKNQNVSEEEEIKDEINPEEIILQTETYDDNEIEDEIEADEEIEEANKSIPDVNISQAESKTASVKKGENSIRVDVERLDELLNFVQELVLGRNRLSQITHEVSLEFEGSKISRDLAETSRHIDLMTTELQLAVMKTRMIRIGKVFNRFPRLVRDLSKDLKKDIQLVINGEDTELDKTLIEEINDPLVHLVRNAIDHGIESPEVRKAAGKNPQGTVTLSAEHEGNNIIITIQDDGFGIDPEKIKAKAISKGIISAEKAKELSKVETYNLIFAPGFSTAEIVTNVSGRGVGMDVVKTNVAKLRGIINIESEVGKGSKIIIKLPLTLAIIQGLLVEISHETVVIPLNSVVEVVRIPKNQIYKVNQTPCIKLRDTVHPLISIDKLLYSANGNGKDKNWQFVVIVGIAEKRFGITVDELVGQKEIVIKTLGSYLGNIEGVAGSTIMGDGKVVMIVDIAELVHKLLDKN